MHLTKGGSAYARERFTETFGSLNGEVELGNHTMVWIDAPGLLEERSLAAEAFEKDEFEASNGGVIEFLRSFRAGVLIPFSKWYEEVKSIEQHRIHCPGYCSPIYPFLDPKAHIVALFEKHKVTSVKVVGVRRFPIHSGNTNLIDFS